MTLANENFSNSEERAGYSLQSCEWKHKQLKIVRRLAYMYKVANDRVSSSSIKVANGCYNNLVASKVYEAINLEFLGCFEVANNISISCDENSWYATKGVAVQPLPKFTAEEVSTKDNALIILANNNIITTRAAARVANECGKLFIGALNALKLHYCSINEQLEANQVATMVAAVEEVQEFLAATDETFAEAKVDIANAVAAPVVEAVKVSSKRRAPRSKKPKTLEEINAALAAFEF